MTTHRKRLRWFAFAFVIGVVGVGVAVTAALALTPIPGGLVQWGDLVLVNGELGDQNDPHVSGDLAVYTDGSSGSTLIRYFDFLTYVDAEVPPGLDTVDLLSDVSGSRITFSRVFADRVSVMVYDVSSGTLSEIDSTPGSKRFGTAIGGNTIAWADLSVGNGDVFAYDLPGGPPLNLSASPDVDGDPSIAPGGNAVVWERTSAANRGIMKSIRTGGVWSAPQVVSDTIDEESNPDTDGAWVVYDSDRAGSTTGRDIYFQPLAGGPETQLQIPGADRNPTISNGIIAFEHTDATPGAKSDLFVYVIAVNMLFQVTNTPDLGEHLNDISVLSDGRVRTVWAVDESEADSTTGNIRAGTFTLPGVWTSSQPPSIAKAFGAASILLGGNTSLTFTLTNPNATTLTGVSFTDPLPGGMIVATPNGLTGSCGGTVSAAAGSGSITLTGGTLAANAGCTFSVTVIGQQVGSWTNVTSNVTSLEGGSGGTASATLTVQSPLRNCHGGQISDLAQLYKGLHNAALSLGFSSVQALQDSIRAACGQ